MRRRRPIAIALATLVVVVLAAYGTTSALIWNRLTSVPGDCPAGWDGNDPGGFDLPPDATAVDAAQYAVAGAQDVRIPSRDAELELAGWWLPARQADGPAVVVVHGHTSCRRDPTVLLPAGMLHRNGFSVLLVDLRDHGDSTLEDGRHAGGTEEYRDVLGAWDWVTGEQGIAPERVGLLGVSLGAATVLIAAGEEPRVAAVWEDSSFADIGVAIRAELERNGYPVFLEAGGLTMARLLSGDELSSLSPLEAVRKLDGRPLHVTHGTADRRLSVGYAADLVAAVEADGGRVESWIVEGAGHVQAMLLHPDEYETRLVRFFRQALASPR